MDLHFIFIDILFVFYFLPLIILLQSIGNFSIERQIKVVVSHLICTDRAGIDPTLPAHKPSWAATTETAPTSWNAVCDRLHLKRVEMDVRLATVTSCYSQAFESEHKSAQSAVTQDGGEKWSKVKCGGRPLREVCSKRLLRHGFFCRPLSLGGPERPPFTRVARGRRAPGNRRGIRLAAIQAPARPSAEDHLAGAGHS